MIELFKCVFFINRVYPQLTCSKINLKTGLSTWYICFEKLIIIKSVSAKYHYTSHDERQAKEF